MQDSKLQHRTLGFQICGLFVEVEAAKFEHHLSVILPLIQRQINPVQFQKVFPNCKYSRRAELILTFSVVIFLTETHFILRQHYY